MRSMQEQDRFQGEYVVLLHRVDSRICEKYQQCMTEQRILHKAAAHCVQYNRHTILSHFEYILSQKAVESSSPSLLRFPKLSLPSSSSFRALCFIFSCHSSYCSSASFFIPFIWVADCLRLPFER